MSEHPKDGFQYPIVERVEVFDGGARIGAIVIDETGHKRAIRWRFADIEPLAEVTINSNIRAA